MIGYSIASARRHLDRSSGEAKRYLFIRGTRSEEYILDFDPPCIAKMPTPAKKKSLPASDSSPSGQTLLNFFAKNSQANASGSSSKRIRQETNSTTKKASVTEGNSFDQPLVISDDDDEAVSLPARPAVPPRSRVRSDGSNSGGLQSNGLLARRMSPSPTREDAQAPAVGSDEQPIDVELWDDDQEEGMGMDDPEEDQLVEDLEAVELESNAGEGPSRRNSLRQTFETDGDINEDALNPTTSGRKRKTQRRPTSRPKSDESGEEDRSDLDDPADSVACPVCGKTFVALTDDVSTSLPKCKAGADPPSPAQKAKRMHVNTCLDSSWAKPEPCEPLQAGSLGDVEEIRPVAPALPSKASRQQPISAFCVSAKTSKPEPKSEKDEDVASAKGPNAFSVLMSGHKEDKQWKVAEEDLRRDGKRVYGRRKAPFYKVLTGMPIAVDAFRYGNIPGVKAYFLTHAHSDHYTNLSGSWKNGPIYCSETTANLIKLMLGVNPEYVHGLPWDVPFEIPDTGGVKVTVIKANHCPGSSIFLYEGRQTANAGDSEIKSPYVGSKREWRYLHCGDFRACPAHVLHPAIASKKIDTVYLDTTYLNPQYCFPPQPLVIAACADLARRTVLGQKAADAIVSVKTEGGEEDDVKPYLAGQEGANFDERGRELMANWLVNEDENVKTDGDEEIKPTKGRRTLVIMG